MKSFVPGFDRTPLDGVESVNILVVGSMANTLLSSEVLGV